MKCENKSCGAFLSENFFNCPKCGAPLKGGIVFVTGISGSGTREYLDKVLKEAAEHGHLPVRHDIGHIMRRRAEKWQLDVDWDYILDIAPSALRALRGSAFEEVALQHELRPDELHLVDLHLSFRWRAYLTKGYKPRLLEEFKDHARLFINVIEDVAKIRERLSKTAWANKKIQELLLLVWRDEELLLTDLFADMCGLERSYAVAAGEPPSLVEKLIWHPELTKVYLSFPITSLEDDPEAKAEIKQFRDRIRDFLVVFDPHACKDYDETYKKTEMRALREEIGDITEERDYRFINQADAVVVYFPKVVPSTGVHAEMVHAKHAGKPIFMCSPENGRYPGPFSVVPSHFRPNQRDFIELLKSELSSG